MQTQMSPSGGLLLASLQQRLPKQTFDTWFRSLTVDESPSNAVFTFSAPNLIVKDWVVDRYAELITQLLGELSLGHYRIEWSTDNAATKESKRSSPTEISPPVQEAFLSGPQLEQADEIPPFVETTPSSLNERYTFSNF